MERVAIYLRKSRSDIEHETAGEDTLARHRRTLLKFAKERDMNIVRIYEEIVSGEKIVNRPQMQALLNDVQNGLYEAVLVMDMDRLGRGNMQEQGMIIDTFRESGTLIVTPRKTYDLRNEMDEEWSEFEAFMARKELKIITRRLQSGRIRSAQEGNFNGTYAPFGYTVQKNGRSRTLVPHPEYSKTVKLIFNLYVNENMGMFRLADYLNEKGVTFADGKPFREWNINQILKNRVYTGMIVWNKRASKPHPNPEKKRKSQKRKEEDIVYAKGKHPPIIDDALFERAQQKIRNRDNPSKHTQRELQNPLAGILRCALCKKMMSRNCSSREKVFVRCTTKGCENGGTLMARVEDEIVRQLELLMESHKVRVKPKEISVDNEKTMLNASLREWNELKRQKEQLHDLLERGVYSVEMYLERSNILAARIKQKEDSITSLRSELEEKERKQKTRRDFAPALINVMKVYHKTKSIEKKNMLLKSILHEVTFKKEKRKKDSFFELVLYPKIPE